MSASANAISARGRPDSAITYASRGRLTGTAQRSKPGPATQLRVRPSPRSPARFPMHPAKRPRGSEDRSRLRDRRRRPATSQCSRGLHLGSRPSPSPLPRLLAAFTLAGCDMIHIPFRLRPRFGLVRGRARILWVSPSTARAMVRARRARSASTLLRIGTGTLICERPRATRQATRRLQVVAVEVGTHTPLTRSQTSCDTPQPARATAARHSTMPRRAPLPSRPAQPHQTRSRASRKRSRALHHIVQQRERDLHDRYAPRIDPDDSRADRPRCRRTLHGQTRRPLAGETVSLRKQRAHRFITPHHATISRGKP
jgi:hypothetical protein